MLPLENSYKMPVPCHNPWENSRLSMLLSDRLKLPEDFGGMFPATHARAEVILMYMEISAEF